MVVTKRPRWAETPSSARASAPSTSPRNSASPDSVAAKPRRTPRAQRSRRDTGPHASHAGDQATSFDVAVFSLVSAICCSTSRAYTSSASFGLSVSLSVGSCSHCGAGQPCRCAAAHAAGRRSPAAGCRPSPAKSFPANATLAFVGASRAARGAAASSFIALAALASPARTTAIVANTHIDDRRSNAGHSTASALSASPAARCRSAMNNNSSGSPEMSPYSHAPFFRPPQRLRR